MAVSITRRKTGSGSLRYRAQVRVPGHHHVSKTFGRKKAANDWGRQEEDRLRSLMPGSPVNRTVSEAIARYKEEQLPELKSSVPRDRQLDWWDAQVGHLKLFEITPAHIAYCMRLLRDHEPGEWSRSPATINRYHSTIGAVFVQAHKKWHWMSSNPLRRITHFIGHRLRTRTFLAGALLSTFVSARH